MTEPDGWICTLPGQPPVIIKRWRTVQAMKEYDKNLVVQPFIYLPPPPKVKPDD